MDFLDMGAASCAWDAGHKHGAVVLATDDEAAELEGVLEDDEETQTRRHETLLLCFPIYVAIRRAHPQQRRTRRTRA